MSSLKSRFEELIHMEWDEFCHLEKDPNATIDDVVLCQLIRTCADTDDISAIKLAFDRIDGLQATLIEVKVPKFYHRYPRAKSKEDAPADQKQLEGGDKVAVPEPSSYDPATASLRETLKEMRGMPRDVIRVVRLYKQRIEKAIASDTGIHPDQKRPMVKSVIVANLLKNVQKGKFKAVELVFDQIDGKLPKAIQLLGGEDVVVDDTTVLVAPAHAELGEDGVWRAENKEMTTIWLRGFANSQKGLEMIAEGLDDE